MLLVTLQHVTRHEASRRSRRILETSKRRTWLGRLGAAEQKWGRKWVGGTQNTGTGSTGAGAAGGTRKDLKGLGKTLKVTKGRHGPHGGPVDSRIEATRLCSPNGPYGLYSIEPYRAL